MENIKLQEAVIQLIFYEPHFADDILPVSTQRGDLVMIWRNEKHLEKFRVIYFI